MKFIVFAIYLGIGAMLHAFFVGPQFDWASAWTFGWLLGWPIMVIAATWTFAIGISVSGGIIWCLWAYFDAFAHWVDRRKRTAK